MARVMWVSKARKKLLVPIFTTSPISLQERVFGKIIFLINYLHQTIWAESNKSSAKQNNALLYIARVKTQPQHAISHGPVRCE